MSYCRFTLHEKHTIRLVESNVAEGATRAADPDPSVDEAEGDEDEQDDTQVQFLGMGVDETAVILLRWLRLHVTHFQALYMTSPLSALQVAMTAG